MRPDNAYGLVYSFVAAKNKEDALESNLVLTTELCKTSHLVLIPDRPAFRA